MHHVHNDEQTVIETNTKTKKTKSQRNRNRNRLQEIKYGKTLRRTSNMRPPKQWGQVSFS